MAEAEGWQQKEIGIPYQKPHLRDFELTCEVARDGENFALLMFSVRAAPGSEFLRRAQDLAERLSVAVRVAGDPPEGAVIHGDPAVLAAMVRSAVAQETKFVGGRDVVDVAALRTRLPWLF